MIIDDIESFESLLFGEEEEDLDIDISFLLHHYGSDFANKFSELILNLQAYAEAKKNLADKFIRQYKACSQRALKAKSILASYMEKEGIEKIEGSSFSISLVNTGGKTSIKYLKELTEIPEEYISVRPEINTAKVRKALEAGEQLDFAELEQRGKHIRIK
ncbi:MAG: hypothetical protein CV045_02850 [Cyanobacteria bacterium M5B4]|nr:MAG: hypothetical protein CV045_02850 [Cyanobacteria bacterium M5B4]